MDEGNHHSAAQDLLQKCQGTYGTILADPQIVFQYPRQVAFRAPGYGIKKHELP